MTDALTLTPNQATLDSIIAASNHKGEVLLDRAARERVEAAYAIVERAASGDAAVYGVNTGFGKLAQTRIPPSETAILQRNLILSHCAGVGDASPTSIVRLMMILKLLSLGRGASGVRWSLIELLEGMISRDVTPVVPAQGSVGASGDLAPLAHMAAVMIGEGTAIHDNLEKPSAKALADAGLGPIELGPKEGLALINGTQFSTANALQGLFGAWTLAQSSLATGALSTDAAMGSAAPFRTELNALRGQPGQIDAAKCLRTLMAGSEVRESHRENDDRVQDPYCLRCQPQVAGACIDMLRQAATTIEREANAATDNPLVIIESGAILSGGNFHAEPIAFAADQIALAIAETGAISQRRIAMLVDPAMNFGLPAFLSPNPGVNSGLMIADVASAALMSENKQMASPCSVDSTPTSANQEDHVSMAAHAARRLHAMNKNLASIVGIEWLAAAQGVEFRTPLKTSAPLQRAIAALRARVPSLGEDRMIAPDIAAAAELVSAGALIEAVGRDAFPELRSQ